MTFEKLMEKLSDAKIFAEENFVPIIRDKSAKFLYDFVEKNNFKNILEIGTAIGYSGSIMLSACNSKLTTVDKNEKLIDYANNVFSELGYSERVRVYCNDAKNLIESLSQDGEKFDMIFLDGAKGQYINYLPVLTSLLNAGGVILADNVLLQGMVESTEKIPHRKRTMVVNLRKYLEVVSKHPYETELLHLEDGLAITRLKG
ncbi:MAG: O-methyltransferase [Clostridiales bacterium]|nr:O-methyltransferase [Clostridiales bacterium]